MSATFFSSLPCVNDTDGATTEALLEIEIAKHGLATVEEHLRIIFGRGRWNDWQRIANIARTVAKRIERRAQGGRNDDRTR